MGAGKPGDIEYLAAIARPDIGLVTLIAPAHLARMGSIEGVAETKGALYRSLPADGVAIINADDAFASFFGGLAGTRQVLRFGLDNPADIGADIIEQRMDGSRFVLITPRGNAEVMLSLPGRHNIANALAATAVALALDVPLKTITEGLEQAAGVAGRLRREVTPGGWTLVDDSYNANPSSIAVAIDTLMLAEGERWLVLGDMAELGNDARELHAQIGALARERGVDRLFAVGPLGAATVEAFGAHGAHFDDKGALIDALNTQIRAGVTCLIKGSRSAGMEQVATALARFETDTKQRNGGTFDVA
jgi:UDP-N-acetylmuramoyl-tripeptide--D-alanyl-D-alanine ligase